MNIIITQSLGTAIRNLQNDWRIQRIKRRRYSSYYLWAPGREQSADRIPDDLIKQLEKMKFIAGQEVDYRLRYWRGANREYRATDKCAIFHLPPEQFWVPDGQ